MTALSDRIVELVRDKRANPADDLLSTLTTSYLTDEEVGGTGVFLFTADQDRS